MAGCGDRPLPASLAPRIFGGEQAEEFHELSGVIETGEVPEFRHRGDRHRALDTTQGLERVDHRVEAPRFDLGVARLVKTLEACGVFVDRADIFLADEVLRGCGTADLCEPPQVGRAPGGP
jgi:hypothetical protein